MPDLKNFLVATSVADAATINPNGTRILLANGVNALSINVNQFSLMDPEF